jgi:hypothetical protein
MAVGGWTGVAAVGADPPRPARDRLAGPAAASGRRTRADLAGPRQHPPGGGGGERGHGRGGAGQPPAPASSGLAAARPGVVADHVGPGLRVYPLWPGGPAGGAAGRKLPSRVGQRRGHALAVVRRLCPAADPDGVAALAALAVVGQGGGGRGRRVAAGVGRSPGTAVPGVPGHREPAGHPGPASPTAGRRDPDRRRRRPGGAGRWGRVAGGPLPPRPRGGAPAAALAGARGWVWRRWRCWPPSPP